MVDSTTIDITKNESSSNQLQPSNSSPADSISKTPSTHATYKKFGNTADIQFIEDKEDQLYLTLFQRPCVRQYFHEGVIHRRTESEETAAFELFLDLLFVGILAVIGETALEGEDSVHSFHIFLLSFLPAYKLWNDLRDLISTYKTNDVFHRLLIVFIMICLLGYSLNLRYAGLGDEGTTVPITSFYICARCTLGLLYMLYAALLPKFRKYILFQMIGWWIGQSFFIGSLFIDFPGKYVLVWIGIAMDILWPFVTMVIVLGTRYFKKDRKFQFFTYFPAVNIEHRVERTGAFLVLVFGHIILSELYQNVDGNPVNDMFGKAAMVLVIAYFLNWMYFDIDNSRLVIHAIRRHALTGVLYNLAHLPMMMALALVGSSASELVRASDTKNSSPDQLDSHYISHEHIEQYVLWYFCGGLSIALFCMGLVCCAHIHDEANNLRLPKRIRLSARGAICILFACLPLAHDKLNSMEYIAVVMVSVVLLVALELYGTSVSGFQLIGNLPEHRVHRDTKCRDKPEGCQSMS